MISIVMPTMWRPEHYKIMLPRFNSHPLVGEILIIDNNPSAAWLDALELEKVVHLPQEENIFVNPAWNLGAKKAKYDKLCSYSDDAVVSTSCIDAVYDYIKPEYGLIGHAAGSLFNDKVHDIHDPIIWHCHYNNILDIANKINPWYAVCFFVHKQSYYPVPENLKIFYGDNYLFNQNVVNRKPNLEIFDGLVITSMHTTSHSEEFKQIVEADIQQDKPWHF